MESVGCLYVAEFWLDAVINGDFSGLSEQEIGDLKNYLPLDCHAEIAKGLPLDVGPVYTLDRVLGYRTNCYLVEFFA